jgi:hypothetical protein
MNPCLALDANANACIAEGALQRVLLLPAACHSSLLHHKVTCYSQNI